MSLYVRPPCSTSLYKASPTMPCILLVAHAIRHRDFFGHHFHFRSSARAHEGNSMVCTALSLLSASMHNTTLSFLLIFAGTTSSYVAISYAYSMYSIYIIVNLTFTSGNRTPGSRFYSHLLDPLFASTSSYSNVAQSARLLM